MVQVIAERLGGDVQCAGDGRGVGAFGKELQDTALLLGERLDRGVMGSAAGKGNKLPGSSVSSMAPLVVPPPGF